MTVRSLVSYTAFFKLIHIAFSPHHIWAHWWIWSRLLRSDFLPQSLCTWAFLLPGILLCILASSSSSSPQGSPFQRGALWLSSVIFYPSPLSVSDIKEIFLHYICPFICPCASWCQALVIHCISCTQYRAWHMVVVEIFVG